MKRPPKVYYYTILTALTAIVVSGVIGGVIGALLMSLANYILGG